MITMKGKGAIDILHSKGRFRPNNDGVIVVPEELEKQLTGLGFTRVVAEDVPLAVPVADVVATELSPIAPSSAETPVTTVAPPDPAIVGTISGTPVETDADQAARQALVQELVDGGMSLEEATALVDAEQPTSSS